MALHRRRHRQHGGPDSSIVREEKHDGEQQPSSDESKQRKYGSSSSAVVSTMNASPPPQPPQCAKQTSSTTATSSLIDAASKHEVSTTPPSKSTQSFHVTKFVILRLVGFVYLIAFVGAYHQNRGLMGSNGLVPARQYMDQLKQTFDDSPVQGFLSHPTLYWFIDSSLEDWHLDATALIGSILSLVVVLGLDSWLAMVLLWILDFSIVTVAEGTSFYAYGWESQLLETGFLSIWLCDLPTLFRGDGMKGVFRDMTPSSSPSLPVLW
eukprot:CAMPEP_0201600406 /NCGR_PEP_ID=MMETSP0492-20130828/1470_1 /ASSEMBLY_ACC=CAM_ASM_000837 /TAXON_ID=420259 /ORGANISM="Thalassiosira gravida, Strain GMp14c1" /LENGTH=265 /DNA_ID=CAMNT_0048063137 /DNA_START=106 /DNA_END=900 /DNA_ORIENTATION=-